MKFMMKLKFERRLFEYFGRVRRFLATSNRPAL